MNKKIFKIPQTWDELVEMTVLKELKICGKDYVDVYRKRIKRDKGFYYNGVVYRQDGSLTFKNFVGCETVFRKDLSLEQMYLFFYIENISKEEK